MSERVHEGDAATSDESPAYEEPVVEDLESVDGPAVTAAAKTTPT